jgi:hypothetical protein
VEKPNSSIVVPAGRGNVGSPGAPATPDAEPSIDWWLRGIGQTSWAPPVSTSYTPVQEGLLASLGAQTGGGILGQLALPTEQLDPAKYWGAATAWPGLGLGPASGGNSHPSPESHAPNWETMPPRVVAGAAVRLPEPPTRRSWDTPAGNPDVAQQMSGGGGGANGHPGIMSDAASDNDCIPNAQYAAEGHHHNPRAIYGKMPLPEETRKVFDKATTGPLPFRRWHENDALHREYSKAVGELMERFMKEHNIKAEQMTPDQARSVLKAIADSDEPRIRVYGEMLKRMWMFYRLRSGARGNE